MNCTNCGSDIGTAGCARCSQKLWWPVGSVAPPVPVPPAWPPPVCTGTGTVAVDFAEIATQIATEGECGICGQRARLSDGQHLVTHPYTPKARGEARDAR